MVFYLPSLDPYPGYTSIRNEVLVDNTDYEPLPGGEQIRPNRHANILSNWVNRSLYTQPETSDAAVEVLDELMEKGTLLSRKNHVLEASAYNLMIEYLCSNGNTNKAQTFFSSWWRKVWMTRPCLKGWDPSWSLWMSTTGYVIYLPRPFNGHNETKSWTLCTSHE
jgi:pentatricopeptide repeat protein